jgi:triosephosphate isomerase
MKKIYLIANWKMNPTSQSEAKKLASDISRGAKFKVKNIEVILCPPFTYLSDVKSQMSNVSYLGAQDVYFEDSGSYTGEVSPKMLKDVGCEYVIVGHSERRQYFSEDSVVINKKLKAILKNKMTPILAIGEKDRNGEPNTAWYEIVRRQLVEALDGASAAKAQKIMIAYEPVWAIGTGIAATADDALTAKLLIQKTLTQLYSKSLAQKIPIIYGGSTDSKNIAQFVTDAQMDGALVGGSSLNAKEFLAMLSAIA